MAPIPNFLADLQAAGHDVAALIGHHPASAAPQTPAPQPVTLAPDGAAHPKETPMSLAADLHAFAARLDKIGEETVAKVEHIVASPAGADALTLLHDVTGLGIDPAIIDSALGGLKALLQAYEPPQGAPAQGAAPSAPAQAAPAKDGQPQTAPAAQ